MNLKFELIRGKYSCSDVKVNGFRIGGISWSLLRNDPLPHVGHVSLCGREGQKQFATESEALEWVKTAAANTIKKLAGIE